MRKVIVELKINVVMLVDEGIGISEIIDELDYNIIDTTTKADIVDTALVDYEIEDSK